MTTTLEAVPTQSLPINAPTSAPPMALTNLFRPKAAQAAETAMTKPVPAGVAGAVDVANSLLASYAQLKVEVLDRSDRALWALLGEVYAYVAAVDGSPLKRETRAELIRQISQRTGSSVSTAATTAAIVVRYIFADQSRQTWSNYTIAMEKAAALGVTTDSFAGFLEQYGGVTKVVEHTFDYQADDAATAAEIAREQRDTKQSRVGLVGRLCTALAHASTVQLTYREPLHVWVPTKPKKAAKAAKSAGKDDKLDPKFEKGKFVVFLTVPDTTTGTYRVVQGNVFNRAVEEQLLAAMAERMGADADELTQAVVSLEQSINGAAG